MSILTFAPSTGGLSPEALDRAAGRADAYDDHTGLTIDELSIRAGYLLDFHPNQAYAQGYSAYVKGEQLYEQAASGRSEPSLEPVTVPDQARDS